ncbi:MAG: hypothetical protein JW787_09660 [Sedimentisphaerales bacterium]|nr:hypothetical protein [Sedimentisphaerales bacterium]
MNLENDGFLTRYKWHIIIICAVSVFAAILLSFSDRFQTSQEGFYPQIAWLLGAIIVLGALITMLSRVIKILDALQDNSAKLEELTKALEEIHAGLAQINKSTRISDTVKSIAFKDADRQSLREVVFEKLQAKDFSAAKEIIEEIARHPEYEELAEDLMSEAEKYQNATEQERLNQVTAHIEKLIDDAQWKRASAQIEGLIKAHPYSDQAKNMRLVLYERKQERKKILLAAWDDAVTNQETDRSLEILKELDSYLSPNEASAFQEAASDIFRTKLHSLGMQFSIAVTERRWADALDIGQKIIKDFPNSKMCQEIYTKLDVLKQNVELQKI